MNDDRGVRSSYVPGVSFVRYRRVRPTSAAVSGLTALDLSAFAIAGHGAAEGNQLPLLSAVFGRSVFNCFFMNCLFMRVVRVAAHLQEWTLKAPNSDSFVAEKVRWCGSDA